MAVCPRWEQESWYQCLGTQDAALLKHLPAAPDAEHLVWFLLCCQAEKRMDVTWGMQSGVWCDGLLWEGTCVC